jgi:hypothetical protein
VIAEYFALIGFVLPLVERLAFPHNDGCGDPSACETFGAGYEAILS